LQKYTALSHFAHLKGAQPNTETALDIQNNGLFWVI